MSNITALDSAREHFAGSVFPQFGLKAMASIDHATVVRIGWFILPRGKTSDEFLEVTLKFMGVQTVQPLNRHNVTNGEAKEYWWEPSPGI